MRTEVKNKNLFLAFLVLASICAGGCKSGGRAGGTKPVLNRALFPDKIGSFQLSGEPFADALFGEYQAVYKNPAEESVLFKPHEGKNLIPSYKGDGEALLEHE